MNEMAPPDAGKSESANPCDPDERKIFDAARWLVKTRNEPGRCHARIIPDLKRMFGLSGLQACEAIAQEVRDSLPEGLDFGGFVIDDMTDPDSLLSLRYEQFIAPLIRAVQELSAKVKELEGK